MNPNGANLPAALGSNRREDAVAPLRALALARGVSEEEFDAALAEDRLDLLVVEHLLVDVAGSKTGEEVSRSSGMPLEQAGRLWRALGFPEAGAAAVFSDEDVEALRTIRGFAELGVSSPETSVQMTRVLGQSMARLADALMASSEAASESFGRPEWATRPEDDGLLAAQMLAVSSELVLPSMENLLVYAWRRHVQAAAHRRATIRRDGSRGGSMTEQLTVGFADMVGFTSLSSQLGTDALARLVDRFEDVAHSTVVSGGGRPVKMIGDEVMFVTADALSAVRIALALVEVYADDEVLSDVRVGLASGPVLTREGDFFGLVVNRAHRTVSIADAGTVLTDDEVRDEVVAVGAPGDLSWEALKPRELKDIGRIRLWHVGRPGRGPSERRRSGRRWRRLSEVGPELAVLRERGAAQAARIRPQGSGS